MLTLYKTRSSVYFHAKQLSTGFVCSLEWTHDLLNWLQRNNLNWFQFSFQCDCFQHAPIQRVVMRWFPLSKVRFSLTFEVSRHLYFDSPKNISSLNAQVQCRVRRDLEQGFIRAALPSLCSVIFYSIADPNIHALKKVPCLRENNIWV